MKVCVIAGSPKGKYSITYQTALYLEKRYPQDSFTPLFAGAQIKSLEKDMTPAIEAIKAADLLLFCYPVYTFIAPSQLHRFIELLKETKLDLSGKYAAQITTSKHFYDTTAQKYIQENCYDLGLKYIGGLPADMDDLAKEQGQKDAEAFWGLLRFRMEKGISIPDCRVAPKKQGIYVPSGKYTAKRSGDTVAIVADLSGGEEIEKMVSDFRAIYPNETKLIDLNEYPFKGGCLGCFNCATDGTCVYKDGFDSFLREEIQTCSAIVYAFEIRDHSMGSRMKLYDDRQFCNGHRTVTSGMPMGYIIRGDLNAESNLRMIIDGRGEVGGNYIAGIATDRQGVADLAESIKYAIDTKLTQPAAFLGVGGMKIFRDLIWLMRGMMKADHEFYKAHGIYDFPQKQQGTVIKMKLVGAMLRSPKVKKKLGSKMNEGMIMPYAKALKAAEKKVEEETNPPKPKKKLKLKKTK